MDIIHTQKYVVFSALISFLSAVSFFFSVHVPYADAVMTPYGGRSQDVMECECNSCWLVTVGNPKGGSFMYCPEGGTTLYSYYNVYSPAWQLGYASTYTACINPVCDGECCSDGGGSLMIKNGTSDY